MALGTRLGQMQASHKSAILRMHVQKVRKICIFVNSITQNTFKMLKFSSIKSKSEVPT